MRMMVGIPTGEGRSKVHDAAGIGRIADHDAAGVGRWMIHDAAGIGRWMIHDAAGVGRWMMHDAAGGLTPTPDEPPHRSVNLWFLRRRGGSDGWRIVASCPNTRAITPMMPPRWQNPATVHAGEMQGWCLGPPAAWWIIDRTTPAASWIIDRPFPAASCIIDRTTPAS
jgi:hypothetical protein